MDAIKIIFSLLDGSLKFFQAEMAKKKNYYFTYFKDTLFFLKNKSPLI